MDTQRCFVLLFFVITSFSSWGQPPFASVEPASSRVQVSEYVDQQTLVISPDQLIQEESRNGPLHIGSQIPFRISSKSHGLWESSVSGERIWRVKLSISGVRALSLVFSKLDLPLGGRLYILDEDGEIYKGAITHKNLANRSFVTPILKGNEFTLEYNAYKGVSEEPVIQISHVTAYFDHVIPETRVATQSAKRNFGESGSCQVNANCPEGNDWLDQKRATVRIILTNNGKSYACTGTLMNNSQQDCHPYILTADHCVVDTDGNLPSADDYDQWVFYFDYEAQDCDNPLQEGNLADNTSVGCDLVARAGTAGDRDSDFLLVELDNPSDLSFYDVYFAGWDQRNNFSVSGAVPHHPTADIKKIGTYAEPTESDTWGGSVLGTHWRVHWSTTQNGQSVMEQGSSGASLYNAAGLVMGTLTGGSSSCTSGGGQGPNKPDLFGKMTYHFNHSSSSLRPFLDASGSGRSYIPGINYPCTEEPLSVRELRDQKKIKLYPMPAEGGSFYISGFDSSPLQCKMFDLNGKEIEISVKSSGDGQLEINADSHLVGIYLLELTGTSMSVRRKVVFN